MIFYSVGSLIDMCYILKRPTIKPNGKRNRRGTPLGARDRQLHVL